MGVRVTPKLPTAILLTLCLSLAATAPAPAKTSTAGRRRAAVQHRRGHSERHRSSSGGEPKKRQHAAAPANERASRRAGSRRAGRNREVAGTELAAARETAATIATVLATPCQNTELSPDQEDLPLIRAAVLCLINRTRAEHDLPPLQGNPQLEAAAEGHCAELISADYFAHVAPDGETPVQRIAQTGYIPGPSVGYVIGENLAWGTFSLSTPESIVSAWIASPGHLANILESRYRETGVGVTPSVPQSLGEGNPGATYAQEFGVIVH